MGSWGGGEGGGRGGGALKGEEAEAARSSSGRGLAPAPAAGGLREGRGKPASPRTGIKIPAGARGVGGTVLSASSRGGLPGIRCRGRGAVPSAAGKWAGLMCTQVVISRVSGVSGPCLISECVAPLES